jgi:DNA-binding transcriptional ArsR family regulator
LRSLCGLVAQLATQQGIARSDVRFTRREVRETLNLGDTQLRLHLERLAELEYVLLRRDGPGGKYLYELAYDGDPAGDKPHLPGLIDAATLDQIKPHLPGGR